MPRQTDDRVRLLHGPYEAPPLRVGDRTTFNGGPNLWLSWPES
jgi:hypothetical protein